MFRKLLINIFIFWGVVSGLIFTKVLWSAEFNAFDVDSLRTAVQQANANSEDDIIRMAAGIYLLSGLNGEDGAATGDLDIKSNLIIQGAGVGETILEGGGQDRVLHIIGEYSVTINDLAIKGGRVIGQDGAGIYHESGANGSLTINRCLLTDNINSTTAVPFFGGGIYNLEGNLTINNSTISENMSGLSGGGIFNFGGQLNLTNSTVSMNEAQTGGGIENRKNEGDLKITSSTITLNDAEDGGGGINTENGPKILLSNSILAGNSQGLSTRPDCSGAIGTYISEGHNLIGNTNGCEITLSTGDQIGTETNPIDPLLGPLQDNGGPTDTHELLDGSPALDAGDPNCTGEDQRGTTRPQGNACDIGSFEKEVTNSGNNNSSSSGGCSVSFSSNFVPQVGSLFFILISLAALRIIKRFSR